MTTTGPPASTLIEESMVVDTDVHLTVPPEATAPYLDEPFRRSVETTTYENSKAVPYDGWNRGMGGKLEPRSVRDPADVEGPLCEEFSVDVPILNALPMLARIQQTDLAVALMGAYNDLLLDRFLDEHDHFLGLASIATQDPTAAAEEIDRVGDERGIVGILLDTVGPNPPVGDERYDPIYRAAADNDLHVAFHGSVNGGAIEFPRQNQGFERFIEAHVLFHSWGAMMATTSLLVNGVPEKFPELNFVILEAGVSWIPYLAWRLNKEYAIRREEAPLLRRDPEAYIRDRFYFGTQPLGEPRDPTRLRAMFDLVGIDSIAFATDYPHWDFDHPSAVDRYLGDLEPAERERLLAGSAVEAFDLPI